MLKKSKIILHQRKKIQNLKTSKETPALFSEELEPLKLEEEETLILDNLHEEKDKKIDSPKTENPKCLQLQEKWL